MIFVLALAFGVLQILLGAWVFMITVGVIHAEWINTLPTLGYGWAIIIGALISMTVSVFSTDLTKEDR